jgi:hypothetical protein
MGHFGYFIIRGVSEEKSEKTFKKTEKVNTLETEKGG